MERELTKKLHLIAKTIMERPSTNHYGLMGGDLGVLLFLF